MNVLLQKLANDLTVAAREHLKTKSFAVPGERKYPIENEAHARNALARVDQHGTPGEKAQVYAAVAKKYPGLAGRSSVPGVQRAAEKNKEAAANPWTHLVAPAAAGALVGGAGGALVSKEHRLRNAAIGAAAGGGLAAAAGHAVAGGKKMSEGFQELFGKSPLEVMGKKSRTAEERRKIYDFVEQHTKSKPTYASFSKKSSIVLSAMREELARIQQAKLAEFEAGRKGAWEAFKGEAPSALGATVGAAGAGYLGMNPLIGAGLGYGVGALPEAVGGIREWAKRRAIRRG